MELDPTVCYQALRSRDARFDGRFFTGVKTTGVYCRPVCPARTPKRENLSFYACAAAAEAAGFRPCLRCRPETSPGTPAWLGTSATVSRALRLLHDGFLDEFDVDTLASRLGVGARHLRRLFDEHLGASPIEVAQSRRILFAKKLIDETNLNITDIAFASGFSSVRRFNAAFQRAYQRAPRDIRRSKATLSSNGAHVSLRLGYRPPFDWSQFLTFHQARALPGVEWLDGEAYCRTVRVGDAAGIVRIAPNVQKDQLDLAVSTGLAGSLPAIAERVRIMFDLKADPATIDAHLAQDPKLKMLVKSRPGLRVPGGWDAFEIAVRAVIGQQVSVAGARTLCGRVVAKYGDAVGEERYTFPTPERLARVRMNGLGLTQRRIDTIRTLARAVASGDLTLSTYPSLEAAVDALAALPGVGPWTAHYIALRGMNEPDAFPGSDLGLVKAWSTLTGIDVKPKEFEAVADAWRPWRAYAAQHLWASLHMENEDEAE